MFLRVFLVYPRGGVELLIISVGGICSQCILGGIWSYINYFWRGHLMLC